MSKVVALSSERVEGGQILIIVECLCLRLRLEFERVEGGPNSSKGCGSRF